MECRGASPGMWETNHPRARIQVCSRACEPRTCINASAFHHAYVLRGRPACPCLQELPALPVEIHLTCSRSSYIDHSMTSLQSSADTENSALLKETKVPTVVELAGGEPRKGASCPFPDGRRCGSHHPTEPFVTE
jgi:hypothetical protein